MGRRNVLFRNSMNQRMNIKSSEITDEKLYHSRRAVVRAGVLAASTLATAWVYRRLNTPRASNKLPPPLITRATTSPTTAPTPVDPAIAKAFGTDEKQSTFDEITHYNNFYEFSTDKDGVAPAAEGFVTKPWTIEVTGLARKPG